MTYLDTIAQRIKNELPKKIIPSGDTTRLFRLYAVLLIAKENSVDSRDVHNAWVAWMADIDPDHKSLIPFEELDESVSVEDRPFVDAIHKVALEMKR